MKTLITTLFITLAVIGLDAITPALADHGKSMHMGMRHDGGWKARLTDEQSTKISKLKLDYKKKKYPLKARMKQAKIELALLMTSDKPSPKAINKKIDQIVKLKKEKLQLKANHKIAVRKILNDEQRVKFDMKILKKAYHGKKRDSYGHHGRRH